MMRVTFVMKVKVKTLVIKKIQCFRWGRDIRLMTHRHKVNIYVAGTMKLFIGHKEKLVLFQSAVQVVLSSSLQLLTFRHCASSI